MTEPASYVIVARANGKAVQEIFGPKPVLATRSLALAYEVVPIMEWLQRVNEAAKLSALLSQAVDHITRTE